VVSVIVPVRNDRGSHLRTLLAALERQTLPRDRFEILIGDDGSTDGSLDDLDDGGGRIRVVPGPPVNAYAARNRAAAAARAPALVFCDSDVVPEPGWLEAGLAALADADVVAGLIRFDAPARPTPWTLLDIELTKDHERQVRIGNAETANLFVRRDLFERLGGFEDSFHEHGDFDFAERCVAAGARLVFARDAAVSHPTRDRARPVLRMIWDMNRAYAVRASRAGERPVAVKLRCWLPLVSTLRGRRRHELPLGLDRRRLADSGIRPTVRDELLALPVNYIVAPYVRCAAQLYGWWVGRRLRSA
jgi:GT2 family glycosyltransferase